MQISELKVDNVIFHGFIIPFNFNKSMQNFEIIITIAKDAV